MSTPEARDDRIWAWTATEVAAATRSGEVSCREVAAAAVERMAVMNPRLNAITLELADAALACAAVLDDDHARGVTPGPLHGVPITIKDNVDVAGQRTPNGLGALAELIAPADSPVAANLLGAGAVMIGRTNTPEFSMRITTNNPGFGLTRNPWDARISCGGSSGGAGAAVAAGMGAIGHGNDIAGSVRVPALHQGIPGLKPTQGRIPAFVPSASVERATLSALLSTQGPLARSVADLRLALGVMAARDPRDPMWVPAPLTGPDPVLPARVGVVDTIPGLPLAPSVVAALADAARVLTAAGIEVVPVAVPDLLASGRLASRLVFTDMARQMIPVADRIGSEEVRWYFRTLFERFPPITELGEYLDLLAARTTLTRQWLALLEATPVIVAPLLATGLLEIDEDYRSAERLGEIWDGLAPSFSVNLVGLPAVLAPTGLHGGLPTGVQLVGGRYREDRCLAVAEVIEAATGRLRPPISV